ncbi:hypothetical protein OG462_44065 [Streptomyces sp. NBC_01077]|nr:hypothetical protein OG462_00940 [Streptomyces sp. NBC_01077]WSV43708.1 hypothetical protein OG462_44065 [Streptomyces sp. NBC_01077]
MPGELLAKKPQAKRTKSAKRLLKKRSRKEARHSDNVNHGVPLVYVDPA